MMKRISLSPCFSRRTSPAFSSRQRQAGQALVEFSLTMVILWTVVIGIIEFGRIVWLYDTVSNLAREIARYTIAVQHQRVPTGTITTSGQDLSPRVDRRR